MSMASLYAIVAHDLVKLFGEVHAVDGISFIVEEGEFFGFLGPNGAGKTTTVRMLTGILPPTSGSVEVLSHDMNKEKLMAKQGMGVVPELANAYPDLTVWQNMMLMAELYGVDRSRRDERADELLSTMDIAGRKNQKAKILSKGLRQRLLIAMALIHGPDLLFLDEPTSGLDVKSTRLVRRLLMELNREGTSIFLTTHNIAEANQLCDRVAILREGKIAATGKPRDLRSSFQKVQSVKLEVEPGIEDSLFLEMDNVRNLEREGEAIRLFTEDPTELAAQLAAMSRENGWKILSLQILRPSLEDVFVEVTEEESWPTQDGS